MDIGLIRLIEACVALGPCRVVDLAGFMDVASSTVSRAVARLEDLGFVVHNAVDADRRAVEVEVTAAGRAQLAGHLRRLTGRVDDFLEEYEGERLPPA